MRKLYSAVLAGVMAAGMSSFASAALVSDFEGGAADYTNNNTTGDWRAAGYAGSMSSLQSYGPAGNEALRFNSYSAAPGRNTTATNSSNPAGGAAADVLYAFSSAQSLAVQYDFALGNYSRNLGQLRVGLIDTAATTTNKGLTAKFEYSNWSNTANIGAVCQLNDSGGAGLISGYTNQSLTYDEVNDYQYRMKLVFSHDNSNLTMTGSLYRISQFGAVGELSLVATLPTATVGIGTGANQLDIDPTGRGLALHLNGYFTRYSTNDPGWSAYQYIDNIDVTLVPEPASLGLLAVGALGLLSRRRQA